MKIRQNPAGIVHHTSDRRLGPVTAFRPRAWLLVTLGLGLLFQTALAQDVPVPLPRAHSHNDYLRSRPLLDALDLGFCSVEADIYLVDGELLVAHDRDKCKPENTLQRLYLDPLLERVRKNSGRVYPGGPELTLLIDFKSEAETTYARLREILESYKEMLTVFTPDATETKAVTVILSGNSPRVIVAAEPKRLVAIDGRLPDLDRGASKHLIPLISSSWGDAFAWKGVGEMPPAERAKLKDILQRAHANGQRVRFWGSPPRLEIWMLLYEEGLDLINADNIAKLKEFLSERQK